MVFFLIFVRDARTTHLKNEIFSFEITRYSVFPSLLFRSSSHVVENIINAIHKVIEFVVFLDAITIYQKE